MAHSRSSSLMVLHFSRWHLLKASQVMKLMNFETHSWVVSLASLEIFTLAGRSHDPAHVRDREEHVLLSQRRELTVVTHCVVPLRLIIRVRH